MKYIIITGLLIFLTFTSYVHAVNSVTSVPEGCDLLGVVHVSPNGRSLDAQAKREIDMLIPALGKRCKDRLIMIEGGYASSRHTEYVTKSMHIAMKVEQYLREKNAVKSDLFIAPMDDKLLSGGKSIVRIVLYPNNFAIEKVDFRRDLTDRMNGK
jgi:hypothetical protein